jgi:hypothetical protein
MAEEKPRIKASKVWCFMVVKVEIDGVFSETREARIVRKISMRVKQFITFGRKCKYFFRNDMNQIDP